MKQIFILAITMLLVINGFFSCSGSGGGTISKEDAAKAFGVTIMTLFTAGMSAAFGQEVEGVEYNKDNETMTFNNYNFSNLKEGDEDAYKDLVYTSLSGTMASSKDQKSSLIDVTFKGGPVKSMKYSLDQSMLSNDTEIVKLKAIVNGKEMDIEYEPPK